MKGYLVLQCFIFNIIVNTALAGIRSPCPLACNCDLEKGVVLCPYGYWKGLPKIPAGTKEVRIKGGEFGKLVRPSWENYINVTHLELCNNGIKSIDEDAFECMPRLEILVIQANPVWNIPNNTFRHVPNLLNITLELNTNRIASRTSANMLNTSTIPFSTVCTNKKLEMVDLSYNYQTYKPGTLNCFRYLGHLSHVNLAYNHISRRVKQTLQPLKNVSVYISLANCYIMSVQDDVFAGFKVTILDLSFNHIQYIQRNAFTRLPNLITLKLAGNPLAQSHEWLGNLHSLLEIDLRFQASKTSVKSKYRSYEESKKSHHLYFYDPFSYITTYSRSRGIYRMNRSAFHNLRKLEILRLGYNNVAGNNLTNLLLDIAHCPLKVLSLSGITLKILNQSFDVFDRNYFEKLYLCRCEITDILPKTFRNFHSLEKLDLSHNEIARLNADTFLGLTNLTTLVLHHNYLIVMNGEYVGLTCPLRHLDLSYNWIWKISFQNISTLTEVDLSHNNVREWIFRNVSLKILRLSSNSFHPHIRNEFSNDLLELDLSDNSKLPWRDLRRLKSLIRLNLSHTPIGKLHSTEQKQIWANSSQLISLDISNCNFKVLPPRLFSSLKNLLILNLSSNQIASVHQYAFQGASSLTELYLQNNAITYVNFKSFGYAPNLRLLALADNPFFCTCEGLWISQAVKNPGLIYIHNQDETVCNGPSVVEKMKDLNLTLSDCETQWSQLILQPIGTGTASILVLVLLYIAWYYRWHIRYTLFLARAGRGRFQEVCDDHEYLYDAFVAYSIEDLHWVKEQMLPNVDVDYFGFGGFKLCLHHRDWLAGIDIAENIVMSIAESRRTILVLSEHFAASYWCRFELAMAHMRLDVEGGKNSRLMVILLSDIPSKLLTPRLVHILGTKTYLPWPKDPNEHQLFWKTLRKSLKKELLYTTKV